MNEQIPYFRQRLQEKLPPMRYEHSLGVSYTAMALAMRYEYDLGSCLYCQLCVRSCPHDAIEFDTAFEHAVFTRGKLVRQLNSEGSTLEKK